MNGGSGSARCDIGAFEARSPVAVAGLDKRVQGGATALDGSASTFNPGRVPSYSWTQVGGTAITLVDATTSSPTFVAPPTAGTLSFELAVTDDLAAPATSTSRVSITINAAPLSNAGMNSTVNTSMEVTLNGTASSDPDGSIVSYAWVQTGGRGVTLTAGPVADEAAAPVAIEVVALGD